MSRLTNTLALCLALAMGATAAALAQAPGAAGNPGTTSLVPPPDAPPPQPTPPGPYAVTIEANPRLMTHTVYRPSDLTPFTGAGRLPIIAWGNGACSNAGLLFATFLTQIASHGFFIVASGPLSEPLPSFARPSAPRPPPAAGAPGAMAGPPPAMTKDADMETAIDWAIKENSRAGGPYFHRLDPTKIAVMGQSCGGLQATANAGDPRVKTVIIWNSGTFPDGGIGRSISGATKASLAKVHTPIAYINGGPHDAAYVNALDDVSRLPADVPVFLGWINVGHGGTYNDAGGGWFGKVGVAWLQWRLKGDQTAAKLFEGADCGLCTDPTWHVSKKGMK
jgi:hypothetical protein